MSMRDLERVIWAELKVVTGNSKIRLKDIMEWSTGPIEAENGEKLIHLPDMNVNVAYKDPS